MAQPDLTFNAEERALLERVAARPGCPWEALDEATVQALSQKEGIDYATALLYDRLRRSPRHGPFIAQVEELPAAAEPVVHDTLLAVVPGAFYVEAKDTGADGQFVLDEAERLGYETARLPLRSFGSLHDNARRLCEWLRARRGQPIVLVSLSKGSAEMKLALANPDAGSLFASVAAWIDLCGLGQGTPIVDWLFRRRFRAFLVRCLFWFRRYSYQALHELQRGEKGALGGDWRLPSHLKVIHVAGFPLSYHLSRPLSRRGHERIGPMGPNDGGATLLTDLARLPGLIYPVWGADHYLKPPWDIRNLMRRLFRHVAEGMNRKGTAP